MHACSCTQRGAARPALMMTPLVDCDRGQGHTNCEHGPIHWGKGDVFTLPCTHQQVQHMTDPNSENGAALFWVRQRSSPPPKTQMHAWMRHACIAGRAAPVAPSRNVAVRLCEARPSVQVNDEPLLKYLGVTATEQRFEPALYKHEVHPPPLVPFWGNQQ